MSRPFPTPHGPFRADQIRSGDPYELSNGHVLHCMTTGGRGSRANLVGGAVLDSDPAVESAGVDTGYSPSDDVLRAPDVAVGNVPDAPGWVRGAPPLAVEYADTGQDEKDLTAKIAELFAAGTKLVWVVRLAGPRRVEVHEPGHPARLARPGEELTARDAAVAAAVRGGRASRARARSSRPRGSCRIRFPSRPSTTATRLTGSPSAISSSARATRTSTRSGRRGGRQEGKRDAKPGEKKDGPCSRTALSTFSKSGGSA